MNNEYTIKHRVVVKDQDGKVIDDFYYEKTPTEKLIVMANRISEQKKPNKAEFLTEVYENGVLVPDSEVDRALQIVSAINMEWSK